jgi:hypothetical protein
MRHFPHAFHPPLSLCIRSLSSPSLGAGTGYCAGEIDLIGTEPIDPNQIILVGSSPVTGLWPSDHFGLVATVRSRDCSVPSLPASKGLCYLLSYPSPSTAELPASRPPNPFARPSSLPNLKHVNGTVVTRRDGSRVLETIDRETGEVLQEPLAAANSVCGICGQDLGFQLMVSSSPIVLHPL